MNWKVLLPCYLMRAERPWLFFAFLLTSQSSNFRFHHSPFVSSHGLVAASPSSSPTSNGHHYQINEGILFKRRGLSFVRRAVGGSEVGNWTDGGSAEGSSEEGQYSLLGAFDEANGALFGTLSGEITQNTVDLFVSDAEGDPDYPTEGFLSIDQALVALRAGILLFDHLEA